KITRRPESGPIPLPSAVKDANGYYVAELDYRKIVEAKSPEENILILPYDVISVPRAKFIYVVGNVRKPGAFALSERDKLTVLQALALSEGLLPDSAPGSSKIVRTTAGATRTEIAVDIKKITGGKTTDVAMEPEDILFVPNSYAKTTIKRTMD